VSAVEDLREAAKLMRERAEAATKGPWVVESRDLWSLVRSAAPDIKWEYERDVMTVHTPDDEWPDCTYVASMHPLVGQALAAWLDELAKRAEEMDSETCGVWPDGTNHTLTIAHAYLGRQS
jgi:hypothetical protein